MGILLSVKVVAYCWLGTGFGKSWKVGGNCQFFSRTSGKVLEIFYMYF